MLVIFFVPVSVWPFHLIEELSNHKVTHAFRMWNRDISVFIFRIIIRTVFTYCWVPKFYYIDDRVAIISIQEDILLFMIIENKPDHTGKKQITHTTDTSPRSLSFEVRDEDPVMGVSFESCDADNSIAKYETNMTGGDEKIEF